MKVKNKQELRDISVEELKKMVTETEKKLVTARLDHVRGQLKNSSSLSIMRKKIAQLLTVIQWKEDYAKNT